MAENPQSLSCPKCGATMRIVLIVPAAPRHPELITYACRACGEVVTKTDGKDGPGAPG
jgi:hypothetical protein